jgi:hypothetical protein
MSQDEDYRKLARDIEQKARSHDGIYRDVLLSVADAYDALVRHQQILDSWERAGEPED